MDPPFPQQTTASAATSAGSDVGGPKDPTNIVTGTAGGDVGGPQDPTNVLKRKRTKRQRPSIVSHSSTSYNTLTSSPASYCDFPADSTTAEDEDTANCLILLSKGHHFSPMNNNSNNMEEFSSYKFNSKRYIQTPTDATNGFTGTYVYECKTCSRTFPSFQALGGHRASHRKPKAVNEFDKPKSPKAFCDEDETNHPSSSQGHNKKIQYSFSKLHECSICGAEFNSGQALGGHMRRHRAANISTAAGTAADAALPLVPYGRVTSVAADDDDNQKSKGDGYCLSLDLNLPAPPETTVTVFNEDQRRESGFKFTVDRKKQQPPSVSLSAAPTLVDCYY